ncbi:MAG: hypothetical protein FJ088_15845, partial [Deltaproteobacteria bacterium]|nr:hypothetical protein [Deltaproteobacteria bacterium]
KITAPVEGSKNKAGIFVAENGKAAARVIEVEELDELRFRVVGGLKEGDLVIVSGVNSLEDGTAINAVEAEE